MLLVINKDRSIFLLILCLATALRLYKLDDYGAFIDEKVTVLVAKSVSPSGANQLDIFSKATFTPQDFWRTKHWEDFRVAITRGDWGNSAAYYKILDAWSDCFGLSDYALRLLSVLFSLFAVVAIYGFTRYFFQNEKIALTASLLASIEPFFISQSHIIRNYSMAMWLAVLAAWAFWEIIENQGKPKQNYWLLVYSLLATLCIFTHYLSFIVFIAHSLFCVCYLRHWKTWIGLALTAILPMLGLWWWVTYGGGQYSLKTVHDIGEFYWQVAHYPPIPNPYAGNIDPATFSNVFRKFIPILGDISLATNNLIPYLTGYKNMATAVFCGIFAFGYWKMKRHHGSIIEQGIMLAIVLGTMFLYSKNGFQFWLLSFNVFAGLILIKRLTKEQLCQKISFLFISTYIPVGWILLQAFTAGHTAGLNQRYCSFAFPMSVVLWAYILYTV